MLIRLGPEAERIRLMCHLVARFPDVLELDLFQSLPRFFYHGVIAGDLHDGVFGTEVEVEPMA